MLANFLHQFKCGHMATIMFNFNASRNGPIVSH